MCDTKQCIKYSPSLQGCQNECTGVFTDDRKCPVCGAWKERVSVDETMEGYPFTQWIWQCKGCE